MDRREEGFLTVRVPAELLDGVTEEAGRMGLGRSALVRHVLAEWLKGRRVDAILDKATKARREGN